MKNKDYEYLTFTQTSKKFPAFTESSLRWHRHKNTNNFNKCVRKIGNKCLISIKDFKEWLDTSYEK